MNHNAKVCAFKRGTAKMIELLSPAGSPEAVIAAVQNGTLSEEQIDTACLRVLRWKEALGLIG